VSLYTCGLGFTTSPSRASRAIGAKSPFGINSQRTSFILEFLENARRTLFVPGEAVRGRQEPNCRHRVVEQTRDRSSAGGGRPHLFVEAVVLAEETIGLVGVVSRGFPIHGQQAVPSAHVSVVLHHGSGNPFWSLPRMCMPNSYWSAKL